MDYFEILRMVRDACRDNFYSGINGVEDKAVESATQIYIEQMRIEAQDANIRQQDLIVCIRSQVRAYKINKLAECNTVTEASAIESAIDDIIKILDDWSVDNE